MATSRNRPREKWVLALVLLVACSAVAFLRRGLDPSGISLLSRNKFVSSDSSHAESQAHSTNSIPLVQKRSRARCSSKDEPNPRLKYSLSQNAPLWQPFDPENEWVLERMKMCSEEGRPVSLPLYSGDALRCFLDAVCDETTQCGLECYTDLERLMGRHPVIFVKADCLPQWFLKWHQWLSTPYVLVTHNSDYDVPDRENAQHSKWLDDPKLIRWFGMNTAMEHPKLATVPIGFENAWHGRLFSTFNSSQIAALREEAVRTAKSELAVLSYTPNRPERIQLLDLFKDKAWRRVEIFNSSSGLDNQRQFMAMLRKYKFGFSPRGNGIDCHRTWEMYLSSVIPIVVHSTIDSVYSQHNLTVFAVDLWEEVTEEALEKFWTENEKYVRDEEIPKQLTVQYWIDVIFKWSTKVVT